MNTFAGEWCTLRGLGSTGLPRTSDRYVGMRILDDGGVLAGTGSTKRPGSDVIFQTRVTGTVQGGSAVLEVSDLDPEVESSGPDFTLVLRIVGARDLEGTITGEPGMAGAITLVRLGPRCFFQ